MGDDLGSLLTDKKNIGKVIQDNEKKRSVIEQLTKKGLILFNHNIKPNAIF